MVEASVKTQAWSGVLLGVGLTSTWREGSLEKGKAWSGGVAGQKYANSGCRGGCGVWRGLGDWSRPSLAVRNWNSDNFVRAGARGGCGSWGDPVWRAA